MSKHTPGAVGARWKTDELGPYIRVMPTGRKAYLRHPSYRVEEIAYHAAGINRYTGGSRFSIAQHMLVGAMLARKFYPEHPLLSHRFMIHDIAETQLGDVSSPLKALLGSSYADLEAQHDLAVEEMFGVTFLGVPEVKELDNRMWLTERLVVYRGLDRDTIDEDVANVGVEPFPLSRGELDRLFRPLDPSVLEAVYGDGLNALLREMDKA